MNSLRLDSRLYTDQSSARTAPEVWLQAKPKTCSVRAVGPLPLCVAHVLVWLEGKGWKMLLPFHAWGLGWKRRVY